MLQIHGINTEIDKVWISSDFHWYHKGITRGTSHWSEKSGCRDFDTIEEMNKTILDNINSVVKPDDLLIHLGDWSFGGFDNVETSRKLVNCKRIISLKGNHDHNITKFKHLQNLFVGYLDYLEFYADKTLVCCFHYPILEWNDINKGSIMLHGHCHTKENFFKNGKIMDCGVDSNHMKPYNLKTILDIMSKVEKTPIHHSGT